MDEKNKEKFSYGKAVFVSLICLVFIIIHVIKPGWVDNITLLLIVIGLSTLVNPIFYQNKV